MNGVHAGRAQLLRWGAWLLPEAVSGPIRRSYARPSAPAADAAHLRHTPAATGPHTRHPPIRRSYAPAQEGPA